MSENNEKENSTKSTPLPLLRNFNNNSNDLPPTTILLHKRTNSTLTLPPDSDFATSSILNMQTNSDSHSIEFQPQNLLENRRKSIMSNSSAKMSVHRSIKAITNNKDDRFGSHLYDDDNDDEGSRDDNLNGEEGETISDDDDISKYNNKNINYEDSLRSPLQRKFYYFFEEPKSKWAKAYEGLSITCTIITVVIICVVSWPTIYLREKEIYHTYWVPFDVVAVIIFTIEYFGRFYASVNKWRFFFKPMSLIDLISIIPFYVQLISKSESHLKFIRVLLLLRVLRLFNVAKYTVGFNITARVFQRSAYQIVMISVYLMVILLASSAIMYFIERGDFHKNDMTWYRTGKDGKLEASPFQSIVHSFWWSIVTLTTTGYGDAVPVTGPGKLVAALTMTCGILVIALPTSIIGSNFNNEWALHRRIRAQMRLQKTRESLSEFTTKTRRIRILQNQNQTMLEALAEIQERLADINPPRYYRKYKKLELKHLDALDRITELEGKLERWKKIAQNLDTFHNHKFHRKGYSDSDAGDGSNISIGEEDNKKIGRKWKNLPFRHFNTASNRDVTRFASVESDNNNLSKHSLLSPFKTLTKLGKTLTLPKNNKKDGTPQFTKELISSPIELRYSFTPIVDPEKPKLVGRPRSSSASNVKSQTTLPSEDNTDKNIDKDLSAENIENENNFTKTTQNNQDITIEKNDYNLVNNSSRNNQNTETGEIEVIVTSNNSNNENF
ncbi:voltage-gated potassium channel [Rhizophagus irregularis]|uniref:Voltage-gated potassium channel n=1 Tax=Rhizophagus irregularis TaxID=588596 RepID=A0A2I1GGW8_9GLOM|nr:voltage-gated potassium channel [Rhizophagus irregularis]